jgi:hypothetical protein
MNPRPDYRAAIAAGCFALLVLALAAIAVADAFGHVGDRRANTTAYCLRGTMADGTYTRPGSAAHNGLRLGTRIRLVGAQAGPGGRRRYVIRDRIGHGTELDLWTGSCGAAIRFGRRTTRYRLGWR